MSESEKTLVTFRHVVPGSSVHEQVTDSEVVTHYFMGGQLSFYAEDHPRLFKDLERLARTPGTGVSRDGAEHPNTAPEQQAAVEQVKDSAAAAAKQVAAAGNRA